MSYVQCMGNPEVLALIKAVGLDANQVGDFSIWCSCRVGNVVELHVSANMFATTEQIAALKALAEKSRVVVDASVLNLDDCEGPREAITIVTERPA